MSLHQQIKEALSKATPGPWKYQKGFYGNRHLVYEVETDNLICAAKTHARTEDNMQLIANAPTWLQQLLDENEQLRTENEALKASQPTKQDWQQGLALINQAESSLSELKQQLEEEDHIYEEHAAMKEALEWVKRIITSGEDYATFGELKSVLVSAKWACDDALSTLSKEQQEPEIVWDEEPVGESCDWCGEPAKELSHPHIFDMAVGNRMCEGCWNHDRDVYKGSYGEDIGPFNPIKEEQPNE